MIGESLFGRKGRWLGPAAFSQLVRYGLCVAEPHPEDGRRRRYRGTGSFDERDWSTYEAEATDARRRFDQLVDVITGPEEKWAESIDNYFGVNEWNCSPAPF